MQYMIENEPLQKSKGKNFEGKGKGMKMDV